MPNIAKRDRKAIRTVDDRSLSECMADFTSTIIKGMIALTVTAILGYAVMASAIIITAIRLAD